MPKLDLFDFDARIVPEETSDDGEAEVVKILRLLLSAHLNPSPTHAISSSPRWSRQPQHLLTSRSGTGKQSTTCRHGKDAAVRNLAGMTAGASAAGQV
jgi:hypothetical protein